MTITDRRAADPGVTFERRPLTATIGAEIVGIDLRHPLHPDQVAGIRQALLDHQVLFFPGQHLDAAQQVAFTAQFGELTLPSAILPSLPGHPEVVQFDRTNFGRYDRGLADDEIGVIDTRESEWHVDITFRPTPPLGATFNAVHVPDAGGDTVFASASVAYERLSPAIQALIDPLTALHETGGYESRRVARGGPKEWEGGVNDLERPIEHPVVAVHPETGRKGLFVNPSFTTRIKELSKLESDALLGLLFEHTTRAEHVVRYRWRTGDLGFWDNRVVWHRRVDDFALDDDRVVQRVQLRGTAPVGPAVASA